MANEELRERLEGVFATFAFDTMSPGVGADVVLAEIEAAGYVLVERAFAWRMARAAAVSECFEDNGAPCLHGEDYRRLDALVAECEEKRWRAAVEQEERERGE
jgi:hypothetical protein